MDTGLGELLSEIKVIGSRLDKSELLLNFTLDQLPGTVWTTTMREDGEIIFVESRGQGLSLLGLRPGQVSGMTLKLFFGVDDNNYFAIQKHREAYQGHTVKYLMEYCDKYWESTVSPLYGLNGEIVGTIGIAIDVTDKILAEQEAKHLDLLYRVSFLRAPVGMVICSIDGKPLHMNERAKEILCINNVDDFEDYVLFDLAKIPQEKIKNLTPGEETEFKVDIDLSKDLPNTSCPHTKTLRVLVGMIKPNGDVKYLIIIRDITDFIAGNQGD